MMNSFCSFFETCKTGRNYPAIISRLCLCGSRLYMILISGEKVLAISLCM